MNTAFVDLLKNLPSNLGGHLILSLTALTVGLLVSIPLGIWAARRPRLSEFFIGVANVIQTVPSLALLALMVPLLGGLIGYVPSFLALVLYSILPILANTVLGIKGVNPQVLKAARGMGMTNWQMLRRVQLPIALPIIIGGIRTASVIVVGTATLATPIGMTTLGNYIFTGLETRDYNSTIFGCAMTALLAVLLDQMIRQLEVAAKVRSRTQAYVGGIGVAVIALGALAYPVVRLVQSQMAKNLTELLGDLPDYLGGHLFLSLTALAVGLVVSLPLGIWASRRPRISGYLVGLAGVLQTIPALALLALMVPLLGLIGYVPAFIVLVLYSILPILANTVLGIKEVDPKVVKAAVGMGMTDSQILWRIQLPLALPVIIGGIRLATVFVVGTATLAIPVGETTLGSYIFLGLQTGNHLSTVLGCVLAGLLAVVLDQLIRLLETAAREHNRVLGNRVGIALAVLALVGLVHPVYSLFVSSDTRVDVGSGSFTEQHILSELLKEHLEKPEHGFKVRQHKGMSEGIQYDALRSGQIDCCVSYTGNIWATIMKEQKMAPPAVIKRDVKNYLDRDGIDCLEPLGFENAYALAIRQSDQDTYGIRTYAQLAHYAPKWTVAGDLQIFDRPEWKNVCATYGLTFRRERGMDPTLMYPALASGSVQVIVAYTTDGRIKANKFVILDDPLKAFPPYDAVILVSRRAKNYKTLKPALEKLNGKIKIELMQQANLRVDGEEEKPRDAAAELLKELKIP